MDEAVPITPGTVAPDFFARTAEGRGLWLQSLRGRTVILHFFPAGTVAAAAEARRYRARADELRAHGIEVVGASAESAEAQAKFAAQHKLPFALVSDERGELARRYGAHVPARPSRGVAFVIDESGAVEVVFERAEDVLGFLRERQRQSLVDAPRSSLRSLSSREGLVVQGRYRLKTLVGRGGLGEVWRAEHLHLKRDVALKILTDPPGGSGAGGDDEWIEPCVRRFRFEAQVSALLGGKTRHIASVFDAGYDNVGPYLAMEFIEGRALDQEMAVRGRFAPEDLCPILDQLADALGAAHEVGVIHRDLKPANVMLQKTSSGGFCVKLTDFGIAKATSETGLDRPKDTAITQLVGTPEYMSPEQLRGTTAAEPTIDVWALGVLVYEALTSTLPFDAPTTAELILQVVRSPFKPLSMIDRQLPPGLDRWMDRALAKDPAERFPSVADAVRAYHGAVDIRSARTSMIEAVAPRETRSAAPVEAPASDRTSVGARRRSWLAVAAVAASGVIATALLWGLHANDGQRTPAPFITATPERAVSAAADAPSGDPARSPAPAPAPAPTAEQRAAATSQASSAKPNASTPAPSGEAPARRGTRRGDASGRKHDPSATF